MARAIIPVFGVRAGGFRLRHGGDEHPCVGRLRAAQDLIACADLDHPAGLHDDHAVRDLGHHTEVMGYEQDACAATLL